MNFNSPNADKREEFWNWYDVTVLFTKEMWKIVPFQIAVWIKIACKCDGNCAVAKVKIVFTPFRWHLWLHRARSLDSILFWGKFCSVQFRLHSNSPFFFDTVYFCPMLRMFISNENEQNTGATKISFLYILYLYLYTLLFSFDGIRSNNTNNGRKSVNDSLF